MKSEISAGGLIVRKKGKKWEILFMKDMNGNWTFPKGLIERNEDPQVCAEREVKEEVGISGLKLISKLQAVEYWYQRKGLIHKTVYYFLFEVKDYSQIKTQKEEGISEAKWINLDGAQDLVGYPKINKKLLEESQMSLRGA